MVTLRRVAVMTFRRPHSTTTTTSPTTAYIDHPYMRTCSAMSVTVRRGYCAYTLSVDAARVHETRQYDATFYGCEVVHITSSVWSTALWKKKE